MAGQPWSPHCFAAPYEPKHAGVCLSACLRVCPCLCMSACLSVSDETDSLPFQSSAGRGPTKPLHALNRVTLAHLARPLDCPCSPGRRVGTGVQFGGAPPDNKGLSQANTLPGGAPWDQDFHVLGMRWSNGTISCGWAGPHSGQAAPAASPSLRRTAALRMPLLTPPCSPGVMCRLLFSSRGPRDLPRDPAESAFCVQLPFPPPWGSRGTLRDPEESASAACAAVWLDGSPVFVTHSRAKDPAKGWYTTATDAPPNAPYDIPFFMGCVSAR